MKSIGLFQAIIIILIPTVPAFFVLRHWLRGLWLALVTPVAAVLAVGVPIALAVMLEARLGQAILPDGRHWIAGILVGAWLLAFLITLVLLAVTAAMGKRSGAKPPTS